jgi:hypothetical protein
MAGGSALCAWCRTQEEQRRRDWRLCAWFSTVMLCGSCFGADLWAARMTQLDSAFNGNDLFLNRNNVQGMALPKLARRVHRDVRDRVPVFEQGQAHGAGPNVGLRITAGGRRAEAVGCRRPRLDGGGCAGQRRGARSQRRRRCTLSKGCRFCQYILCIFRGQQHAGRHRVLRNQPKRGPACWSHSVRAVVLLSWCCCSLSQSE